MMSNEEVRRINMLREAIAENLEYKDLSEELKEKYDEKSFKFIVKKSKEFQKFRHKKAN